MLTQHVGTHSERATFPSPGFSRSVLVVRGEGAFQENAVVGEPFGTASHVKSVAGRAPRGSVLWTANAAQVQGQKKPSSQLLAMSDAAWAALELLWQPLGLWSSQD